MVAVVKNVKVHHDGLVVMVTFEDGHALEFYSNLGGWGMPQSIERTILTLKGKPMAHFHSPFQYPINYKPFGFYDVKPGYTAERIAEYWQIAKDYIFAAFGKGKLVNAWCTVSLSIKDLNQVRAGKWPCPHE